MRTLSLVLLAFPIVAHAQPAEAPKPLAYNLTVKPAAEEAGPVRQALLWSFHDRVPGNAAVGYLRAISYRKGIPAEMIKDEEELDKLLEQSPRGLKGDKVDAYLRAHERVFREIENATRCNQCDWQMEDRINAEGISFVMEEIQQCRGLAAALKYRVRAKLAQGKVDDALRDIRLGITLGRHVGEGPTLIVHLVGIAIESVFLGEIAQVMQTPGAPNLYRALSLLPSPFFRNDVMIEGEQRMLEATLGIGAIRGRHVRHDDAVHVLGRFADLEHSWGAQRPPKKEDTERAAALAHTLFENSFDRLKQRGFSEDELKGLSQEQVAVLDVVSRFRGHYEEMLLLLRLPYSEAIAAGKVYAERHPDGEKGLDFVDIMSRLLMPAVGKIRAADIRLDRQIAMLRVIEAVRLYAAEHDGKLPEKLSDAAERVSMPNDPAMGKSFDYKLERKRAFKLRAQPFDGKEASVANSIEYAVTLAP